MTDQIRVRLSNEDLWKVFNTKTTEMVVTKSGRKMFPKIEFVIEGLISDQHYALFLHIERMCDQRYKYMNGEWLPCGKTETKDTVKRVGHQDGVLLGASWMRSPVSFERVKITNNSLDSSPSNICLTSMCKYIPVLSIYRMNSPTESSDDVNGLKFSIPLTQFIAVTAYQNHSITLLKIEHNPFAKGFRDGGAAERKRCSRSPSSESSPKRSPPTLPSSHSLFSPPSLPTSLSSTLPSSPSTLSFKSAPFPLQYPFPFPIYPSLFPNPSQIPAFNPFLLNLANLNTYTTKLE